MTEAEKNFQRFLDLTDKIRKQVKCSICLLPLYHDPNALAPVEIKHVTGVPTLVHGTCYNNSHQLLAVAPQQKTVTLEEFRDGK